MILALESSCDETAVALFDPEHGLVGEWLHTQIALHENYGGVVPDLATREHLRNFPRLLQLAQPRFPDVRQIAVTNGPGLAGCLAIGLSTAKALALALRVPLAPVNHLRAHIFSPFIPIHARQPAAFRETLAQQLPHLALLVSGGNTLLVELDRQLQITILSTTRDDAAGEALDKGAKLLGLGYPGGPLIEKHAAAGNPAAYDFPRGINARNRLDFSFSGLKTALRYTLEKMTPAEIETRIPDLCASYQQAVIDALARKTQTALSNNSYRSLGLSGGVANNKHLRATLGQVAARHQIPLHAALPKHTGDNAAMIAFAAHLDPAVHFAENNFALPIHPSAEITSTPSD